MDAPVSFAIWSLDLPLRNLCITSDLMVEFGLFNHLYDILWPKSFICKIKSRHLYRHFRHFFRQNRRKTRQFCQPWNERVA